MLREVLIYKNSMKLRKVKMNTVFWVVMRCSLVEVFLPFLKNLLPPPPSTSMHVCVCVCVCVCMYVCKGSLV